MNASRKKVKVITVTGGKGGVGKSSVSLNIAVALCMLGKKAMVFDADLGLANIDVMLGLKVSKNLSNVLKGECELKDIIQTGPHGVRIVPASSGLKEMAELSVAEHSGLIRSFSSLDEDIDFFIVDTAAGISDMVLSFCRAAQDVLMVVCNEATSVADAYAQMKILSKDYGINHFKILANQVHSEEEGKIMFAKLLTVTNRFLDASIELVGCIPSDANMKLALRKRSCVVSLFPRSAASIVFTQLAKSMIRWPVPNTATGHLEFFVENLINSNGTNVEQEEQNV